MIPSYYDPTKYNDGSNAVLDTSVLIIILLHISSKISCDCFPCGCE